jgi:histidyl-tRNA synthetase
MVAARANALRKPVRWFSIPQLFRYERQQKGRLREHFQLNVDIVAEPDVTADAEILAIALDVMRELGLGSADVKARVSHRGLLVALLDAEGIPESARASVFAVLDKLERQPLDVSQRKLEEAGVGGGKAQRLLDLVRVANIDEVSDRYGGNEPVALRCEEMKRYFSLLDALGVGDFVTLDLSIVRGLAYYTGIVFELFDARGEFRAICGGGRYDNLLASLGGADLPAVGFGMGDVVLGELLRSRGLIPEPPFALDYWVASWDGRPTTEAIALASRLRGIGKSVEYALRTQSVNKQVKAAMTAGARAMVVVQTDGRVKVRSFADRTETEAAAEDFIATA